MLLQHRLGFSYQKLASDWWHIVNSEDCYKANHNFVRTKYQDSNPQSHPPTTATVHINHQTCDM